MARCSTEQLQAALNSRVIIEQAKGVLAQRGNLDMHAAFDRLRGYARAHNLRLTEVARQIVETDLAADLLAPAAPKPGSRVNQTTRTLVACGPLLPCSMSNSTRCPSSRLR